MSSCCTEKCPDRADYRYVRRTVFVMVLASSSISNDATAGSFAFLSSTPVRLKGPHKDFPQRTMRFSNSARGARSGATSVMIQVLLCLALLMATGCMAAVPLNTLPVPEDDTKYLVYNFSTDADFNISTKLGFHAPKCSRFCYPWPENNFIDNQVPVWRKPGYRVDDH